MAQSYLVFEDGTVLDGVSFGYEEADFGEVVFNTSMGGYQESLTDPSYRGQILINAFPLIGDYGMIDSANMSDRIQVRGIVVREFCDSPSPMYKGVNIDSYLKEQKIPGISGIDTRELVLKIRNNGTLKGTIVRDKADIENAISKLKTAPMPYESNLVAETTCASPYTVDNGKKSTVGVIDCGMDNGVKYSLSSRFNLKVFPYNTPAQAIIDAGVDGVVISNGPGDPSHPEIRNTVVKAADELSGKMPMLGIGLGCQAIALALGGKTYRMKYGHRGSNQPVKYKGKVYITSQNHGFEVENDSLDGTGLVVTQFNVNDNGVEGFEHTNLPIMASQYNPENQESPEDTKFLFNDFGKMLEVKL